MDESSATSSKMNNILALKHKLQHELQAHLRMQHQLLSQLNQVVLPVIGGDAMPDGDGAAPLDGPAAAAGEPNIQHDNGNEDGYEDGAEDDEDDEDDEEDGDDESGNGKKRPKLER